MVQNNVNEKLSRQGQDVHSLVMNSANTYQKPSCSNDSPIGVRLRNIRKQHRMSIRALADKCGISVNTLSLIENDRSSPNVNTLKLLASGLEIPILSFFEEEKPEEELVYQRQGQRPQMRFSNGTLERLGEGLPPLGAEPILVTLESTKDDIQEINHAGREFIYCLDGKVTCMIAGQPYPLLPGDSLLFNARAPHRWLNDHSEPSKLLVLFCPMEAHDQPAERHLDTSK